MLPRAAVRAIDVSSLDADLLEAVVRLVRLVDAPAESRFLAPLVTREIVYRLLVGAKEARLRQVVSLGGDTHRIAMAVDCLRRGFDLGEQLDATSAGFRVGYDDTSQFSREYRRLFGAPPMRDVTRLRQAALEPAGL